MGVMVDHGSLVILIALCLFTILLVVFNITILKRIAGVRTIGEAGGEQADPFLKLQKLLRDANESSQNKLREVDQGLRAAISDGTRGGLIVAFEQVNAGLATQAAALASFGSTLREEVGAVRVEVASIAERVASALQTIATQLNDRLASGELAAAEGRSALLRETATSIIKTREETSATLILFGGTLKEDVGAVRVEVGAIAEKVSAALQMIATQLNERLSSGELAAADGRSVLLRETATSIVKTREETSAALKLFGEQQRDHLVLVSQGVDKGLEASHAGLAEFRRETGDRLDKVAMSTAELIKGATETFVGINATLVLANEKTDATLASQNVAILDRLALGHVAVSEKLGKDLGDLVAQLRLGFESFTTRLREEQEHLRGHVGTKLDEMRAGNESKLEEMRRAVDEKLQSALEKQIGESFARVAEQFAAVQQAIGQVQNVAGQVGDLKRLFSNVKSRGGWGEAQAEAMLQDMLPAGAYEKNMRMREGTAESVEFALRIPMRGAEDAWLPLDSKFPTEDYERLLNANEAGSREDEALARSALDRRIRQEAERIASKYINAPRTVDFAILYLPSDSLFAEVARSPGLVETVRRNHKVMVMGPSLLPAFLHTVKVGYLTIALEKNVGQIGDTLAAVKTEWGKLEPWLAKLADRADALKKSIDGTQQRARAVGKKLRTVDVIDHVSADAILGLDAVSMSQDENEQLLEESNIAA